MNTRKWTTVRMDMLRRLLGPWGKGASKEARQAWRREYDDLERESGKLSKMLIEGRSEGEH
jgi:hypothetical protein